MHKVPSCGAELYNWPATCSKETKETERRQEILLMLFRGHNGTQAGMCVHEYESAVAFRGQKEAWSFLGVGPQAAVSCPTRELDPNFGPLQDQPRLLTTEASFQPPMLFFLNIFIIFSLFILITEESLLVVSSLNSAMAVWVPLLLSYSTILWPLFLLDTRSDPALKLR